MAADDRKIFANPGDPFSAPQGSVRGISPKAQALVPEIQPILTEAYRAHLNGDYFHSLLGFKRYFLKMVELYPTSNELVSYYFEGRAPGRGSFEPLPTRRIIELTLEDIRGALARPKSNVDRRLIRDISDLIQDHFSNFVKDGELVLADSRLKESARPARDVPDLLAAVRQQKDVNQVGFNSAEYEATTAELVSAATKSTDTNWGSYLLFLAGERHVGVLGKIYQLADTQQQAVTDFTLAISSFPSARFPIDDPISGATTGSPIEPYARLLMARVYENWLEGNVVYGQKGLAAEQLRAIVDKFADPSITMEGPYGNGRVSILGSAMIALLGERQTTPENVAIAKKLLELPDMPYSWWEIGQTRPAALELLSRAETDNAKKAALLSRIIDEYPNAWHGKAGSDDGGCYSRWAFVQLLGTAAAPNDAIAISKKIIETTKNAALKNDAGVKLKELTLQRDASKLFTQHATKDIPIGACVYTFHYDAAKFTEDDVTKFAKYSPNSGQWSVILFEQAQRRAELEKAISEAPASLKPLLECYLTELSFMMEFAERKAKYSSTGDISYLEKPIGGVDPKTVCASAIEGARTAKPGDRENLATFAWGNPVNAEFRKHLCSGNALWGKFLEANGIQEVPSNCDGD